VYEIMDSIYLVLVKTKMAFKFRTGRGFSCSDERLSASQGLRCMQLVLAVQSCVCNVISLAEMYLYVEQVNTNSREAAKAHTHFCYIVL
jgi:hypothetical protein